MTSRNLGQQRRDGSILVILEPPVGIEFGIDCMSYETGPKFHGVSLIPKGIHFVYHSTGVGARQGFFISCGNSDVIPSLWDKASEEIVRDHKLSAESVASLESTIARGDLNANLGPYPLQQHQQWVNLTFLITERVLLRANCGIDTLIVAGDESDLKSSTLAYRSVNNLGLLNLHDAVTDSDKRGDIGPYRVARFVDIVGEEIRYRERIAAAAREDPQTSAIIAGAPLTAAQRLTAFMMDKSPLLEFLIEKQYGGSWADLLGDIQLAFVTFMVLYSFPGLHFWKQMVHLICNCEVLLLSNPEFTSSFVKTLHCQLNYCPADFFETELSSENFLRPVVSALFSALSDNASLTSSLKEHKKRFYVFLRKKFNLYDDAQMETHAAAGASRYRAVVDDGEELPNGGREGDERRENMHEGNGDGCNDDDEDEEEEEEEDSQEGFRDGVARIGKRRGKRGGFREGREDESAAEEWYKACDEEIHYNLVEEDMPVFVSAEEVAASVARFHGQSQGQGPAEGLEEAATDTLGDPESNIAAAIDGMNVTDPKHKNAANMLAQRNQRWEAIDDMLLQKYPRLSTAGFASANAYKSSASNVLEDTRISGTVLNDHAATATPQKKLKTIAGESANPPALLQQLTPLTPSQIEVGLYCWRYPALFDEMTSQNGREDMTMAATRVLDEAIIGADTNSVVDISNSDCLPLGVLNTGSAAAGKHVLLEEARRFIEDEVPKRSNMQQ